MTNPQRSATVHVEQLGDELCIYDWQRKEVHALNPTAAQVWQLCDGQTSPEQIAQILQAELNVPNAEELVWFSLSQIEKAHLLAEPVVKSAKRRVLPRREFLRLGIAAAILPVIHSIVAPTPVAAASPTPIIVPPLPTATPGVVPTPIPIPTPVPPGSQTFNFTGAQQQFTVPAGVASVTIQAFGAQGHGFAAGTLEQGGTIQATISVTPGETLYIYVGGQGGSASGGTGGAGGFNGGGKGGDGISAPGAAGGGGASDVRQGGNGLLNRVVVAGGAGSEGGSGGVGGDGGYPNGLDGINPGPSSMDGKGGTQASGGAAGTGNAGAANGTPGTSGSGGTGGDSTVFAGGGGGGGYFGGGGGGGNDVLVNLEVGAGGGGSSFAIPAATGVSGTIGGRTGNGQVIISWP